jgi:hypothetical protein
MGKCINIISGEESEVSMEGNFIEIPQILNHEVDSYIIINVNKNELSKKIKSIQGKKRRIPDKGLVKGSKDTKTKRTGKPKQAKAIKRPGRNK